MTYCYVAATEQTVFLVKGNVHDDEHSNQNEYGHLSPVLYTMLPDNIFLKFFFRGL